MLQIFLYGDLENDFLDIDPSIVLNMEGVTDLFDEDLSAGEFSIPVDIAWTDKNRRLFGFSERMENFSIKKRSWRCDVYDSGFPEIVNAQLTILEKNGSFSYLRGKFSASISGTEGLFGSLIRNKKMKELELGGLVTWSTLESRKFAEGVMNGDFPQYSYLGFAPVGWEDFFMADRPDYDNEFLAKATVNNIIVGGSSYIFGRPDPGDPTIETTNAISEHRDYRTIPFFKLKYVMQKAFEEHGFVLSGAVMDDIYFDPLFLFNNYAIESYGTPSLYADATRSITPANHMPDMLVKDWLKNVFSFFNVYPVFLGTNQVKLVYRKNTLKEKRLYNIDRICGTEFQITYQDSETKNGFKLNYSWDGSDQYQGDRVKDLTDKILVATVNTFAELGTLVVPGVTLTTAHVVYVKADNLYYALADGTSIPMKWDAYAERLNEYVSGDGENSVELGLSTLCQWVEFNTPDALYERRDYLGTRQPGSYRNNRGTWVINECGLRLFYLSMRSIGGVTIPVTYNHNRDVNNNVITDYSLSLQGSDGFGDSFHKSWQEVKNNLEIAKTQIMIDEQILKDITDNNTYEKDSVQMLLYKTERTIPKKQSMIVYLVPI